VVNLDSNYGGQTEVYDGVDINLNARFGRGGVIGGVRVVMLVEQTLGTGGHHEGGA
jgi:hypothetical protein